MKRESLSAAIAVAMLATGCGGGGIDATKEGPAASQQDSTEWLTTTDAASKDVGEIKWNLPYEPASLDPIRASYFAENQVLTNLCEPLQQLQPDFSIKAGLATASNPKPTQWVYDLTEGAKFWDGSPVTAQDVAYSLQRNMNQETPSAWGFYYRNVDRVQATGDRQVTVTLKRPDYVFNAGMATAGGTIVKADYAKAQGEKLGSPKGGTMCSGPFTFDKWVPGDSLRIKRNEAYWNAERKAKASAVSFRWLPDDNSQTNALSSGAIDGEYQVPYSAIERLTSSQSGKVYKGRTLIQFNLIAVDLDGPLGDARVRRALSMAIDRNALAATAFNGAAEPSRSLVTKDNYGYGKAVFDRAWEARGAPKVDIEGAKRLIAEAKPSGTVVFAYPTGGASYNDQVALAVQAAAKKIGLDFELRGMPQDTYNAQLFDRQALIKAGIDIAETSWFIDVAEPLVMYEQFLPGVSVYNLGEWRNAQVIDLVDRASRTADETKRAELVVQAEKIVERELPWIPLVQTANVLYMNNRITGAPASFVQDYYPWAADIGGR